MAVAIAVPSRHRLRPKSRNGRGGDRNGRNLPSVGQAALMAQGILVRRFAVTGEVFPSGQVRRLPASMSGRCLIFGLRILFGMGRLFRLTKTCGAHRVDGKTALCWQFEQPPGHFDSLLRRCQRLGIIRRPPIQAHTSESLRRLARWAEMGSRSPSWEPGAE